MLSPYTAIPVGWFCPEYRVTTLSSPPYNGTELIVPKPVSAQYRYSPSTTSWFGLFWFGWLRGETRMAVHWPANVPSLIVPSPMVK